MPQTVTTFVSGAIAEKERYAISAVSQN